MCMIHGFETESKVTFKQSEFLARQNLDEDEVGRVILVKRHNDSVVLLMFNSLIEELNEHRSIVNELWVQILCFPHPDILLHLYVMLIEIEVVLFTEKLDLYTLGMIIRTL